MSNDRITKAWAQFRRNVRSLHKDNGFEVRPGSEDRFVPTGDDAVFDGVDASAEELLLDADRRNARTRAKLGIMQRYALSGLATEMAMHEANGNLSTMRYGAKHFVETYPNDSYAKVVAVAATSLREDFDFLCRFRHSGSGAGYRASEELLGVVAYEFSRSIKEGHLLIEATDAFKAAKFDTDPRVIDAVLINLVRNSLYWGRTTGRRPTVVRLDVEKAEYERDTWDEETDTYGTEVDLADIIVVDDNGPGLPPGVGDELFEVGSSGRRSSGIGLYICRTGLESKSQTIIADENPSPLGGARFRIGRMSILRPDQVALDRIEKPRELELAEAVAGLCELVRNGDHVEASRLSDVYEQAAGLAMRIRLRGAESRIEEALLNSIDELHAALEVPREYQPAGLERS